MNNKVTILVNTSDGFEDCWNPFFKLLSKYWKNCNLPILINTEFKTFEYQNLNITASEAHKGALDRRLTWSECLINALHKIESPLVIYMQEDYFIEQEINSELIMEFVDLMIKDEEIKYIGLTDFGSKGPFGSYKDNRLVVVGNNRYRISTQAGIWRKETLLSYLRAEENGWMFEIFGTQRAKKRNELFLTANRSLYSKSNHPIITYIHTGIIKGQWHEKIPSLFKKEGIDSIDFSIRGLYKPKPFLIRKIETASKLLKNPGRFITGMLGK